MEVAARQQEYCLMVMQSRGSEEIEAFCANLLFNKRVDALVVIPSDTTNGDMKHFIPFIQKDIPVALIDRKDEKYPFVNISTDNHRAGYEITRHLLTAGRRRIVHITSNSSSPVFDALRAGYEEAMKTSGLPVKDHYVIPCGLTGQDGMDAIGTLWRRQEKPDAIFTAGDECAAGCITALRQKGISVPRQIAIAGFGNDPVSLTTDPPLTTVDYPASHIGRAAIGQLIDRLCDRAAVRTVATVVLRSGLIVRQSTVMG